MRQCLQLVNKRFERERRNAHPDTEYVLFIASDGESTDGDPRKDAAKVAKSGVLIISCFVSSSDLMEPKRLYSSHMSNWSNGARTMFDLASHVSKDSREARYLLGGGMKVDSGAKPSGNLLSRISEAFGWRADSGAKLFAQINHSELLDEFMRVVLAPIYVEHLSSQTR
jgi:hypothetical protein